MVESGAVSYLASIDWAFGDSTVRDLTHDLHPWPAKFIPDIPATIIEMLSRPGDLVLDPFAGCGTTALESLRAHRSTLALDVNPLATLIVRAKCTVVCSRTRDRIARWVARLAPVGWNAAPSWTPDIPNFDYWFDGPVAAQIAALLDEIDAFGEAQPFLRVVLSSIIVPVSHQESETRYRRVERQVSPLTVLARFKRRIDNGLRMLADLDKAVNGSPSSVTVLCGDARSLTDQIDGIKADLTVFSPPYPNAFDYHLYHRFRMFWLGIDPRPIKDAEIGAHLKYQPSTAWAADMTATFDQLASILRPGGHVVCIVGDGIIKGEVFRSGNRLWEIAEECGFVPLWRTERYVSRTRRTFNLCDSRLRKEHVLVFAR